MKQPKTTPGPILSLLKMKNSIDLVASEMLRNVQKNVTTISILKNVFFVIVNDVIPEK